MSKSAIVTGASRGIGRAIAERLAADGFKIAVNYAGNAAQADETVAAIQAAGGEAFPIKGDVGEEADVARLFAETRKHYGTIDVVVNNAGIMSLSPIAAGDIEAFDKIIRTNLRGTFLMLSYAARNVASGGRIIALSTTVLLRSAPTYGAYIASKCGTEGLVHVLANEMRGKNITVNAVAPGPVATELFLTGKSDELIDQAKKMSPLERLGEPDDIARVVSFLAGPDGAWINNQVLRANGGIGWS